MDGSPPYLVPSMAEIAALPWNGRKVVSTFSGCGGSSLGYRMAGFKVLLASEFVESARECYLANAAPGTIVDGRDIREVSGKDILDQIGLKKGELDLLDGSPPCASFSTTGKREKGWGTVKAYSDTKQRSDDLFFEFTRLLREMQPKMFVAENVRGLIIGKARGYFKMIIRALRSAGYRVRAQVLDAQWLGVPQRRQRIIFIGVRNDLGLEPEHPKPLPYRYSVRDAIPWIRRAIHDTSGTFSHGEFTNEPSPTITVGVNSLNSVHYKIFVEPEASQEGTAIAKKWNQLKPGEVSEKYLNLIRADAREPSPTVTAAAGGRGVAGVMHPYECRKYSILELKRVCGFPDDFVLTGTYAQQWERCGRAVPPVMMSHIARAVLATLERADPCAG